MLWFLNLFTLYREAVSARLRAEDESRAWRNRAERAEERQQSAQTELSEALKRVIDSQSRYQHGAGVFAQADAATPNVNRGIQPQRIQAAALRQQKTATFFNDLNHFFNDPDSDASAA